MENLEILIENLFGRLVLEITSGAEHFLCMILNIHVRNLCEPLCNALVKRCTGWRAEHQRVGNDR